MTDGTTGDDVHQPDGSEVPDVGPDGAGTSAEEAAMQVIPGARAGDGHAPQVPRRTLPDVQDGAGLSDGAELLHTGIEQEAEP